MNGYCASCGEAITDYTDSQCRCGHFLGWPNFRKADAERADLRSRYDTATAALIARGLSALQAELERIVEESRPVVSMTCEAADDLLRGGKYQNYHRQVDIGRRPIASEVDHGDRMMVNHRLYPGYGADLHYAVLSPDGRGLRNYGEVAVSWIVTPTYLGNRSTLLEENEFLFFEKHGLGALGAGVPAGYRAVWADRSKLVVAKLVSEIGPGTSVDDLGRLLLAEGGDRRRDRFVEVVIYGKEGIDGREISEITLMKPITGQGRQERWQIVTETCAARGILVN